ncbi:response regulator [Muricoccus radiodurans]|uniref:response regulator n=1 Tax=Muricoccus radiodurans TaxID=2231721 RepID=UPI003CF18776
MCDVLVIEDDELVLDVMVQALEDAGYEVQLAETPAEALRILQSDEPCHLVLTDIDLADPMNGFDTVRRAREVVPDLRAIYYTGRPINWRGHTLAEGERKLDKPFKLEQLLDAIADLGVQPSRRPAAV